MEKFIMEPAVVKLLQQAIAITSEQERDDMASELIDAEDTCYRVLSEAADAAHAETDHYYKEMRNCLNGHADIAYGLFAALSFPKWNPVRLFAVMTIRYLSRVSKRQERFLARFHVKRE